MSTQPPPKPDQAPPPIPSSTIPSNGGSGSSAQPTPFVIPQRVRSRAPPRTERSTRNQDPRAPVMAKPGPPPPQQLGSTSLTDTRDMNVPPSGNDVDSSRRKFDPNAVAPRSGSPLGPPPSRNPNLRNQPENPQASFGQKPPGSSLPPNSLGRALPSRGERSERFLPPPPPSSPPRQEMTDQQQLLPKDTPQISSNPFIPNRGRASSGAFLSRNNNNTPSTSSRPELPPPPPPLKQDQQISVQQQQQQQSLSSSGQQQQQQPQPFPTDPQEQQQIMQQQNAQMQIWARTVKAHHDSKLQAVKAQQAAEERVRDLESKLKSRDAELARFIKSESNIEKLAASGLTRNQKGELEELESLQEEYEKLCRKQESTAESLKSAQAKIQAYETKTVSLETELGNKEKRIESLSSSVKDVEKRLTESQALLRENNAKLRKLRGDRGSVVSEASVFTSRRVKSLRQGLVELETLKQMEIDELRTTLIELLKEKDEEIERLTGTLKRQVSSNGSSQNGELLETLERQNSKIATLERKLVGIDSTTSTNSDNSDQLKSGTNRQTLLRLKSLESSNKFEVDALLSEMKELKDELEDMRNGYEDAEFRYEAQQIQHDAYLVDLENRHGLEIKELKDKLETMRTAFDDERDSLLTDLFNTEGTLEAMKKYHSRELKVIAQNHSAQIEEIKSQVERSLNSTANTSGLNSPERVEALKNAKARLEVSLTTSLQEKRELDRQLRSMAEQLESQTQQTTGLKEQVAQLKKQCQAVQESDLETNTLLSISNEKVASVTAQLESIKTEFALDVERFKEEIQTLEESKAALEAELDGSNEEFVGLIEKLRSLEIEKQNLEKEMEGLGKTVGVKSMTRELASGISRVQDDSDELFKAKEKIALLESKNSKLLDIISTINVSSEKPASPTTSAALSEAQMAKMRDEYESKLRSAQREIEALKEEVEQLSHDYDLVDVELKTLKLQANSASSLDDKAAAGAREELEREVADLKSKLEVARNELLESGNDASKWSLSEVQDALEKERVVSLATKAQSDTLKSEIAELNEKLSNALLDLKDANDYMDELEREIARLTSEVPESVSVRSPPRSTSVSPRGRLSPATSEAPISALTTPREVVARYVSVTDPSTAIDPTISELEIKLKDAIANVENLTSELSAVQKEKAVLIDQLKLTEEHSISTREQLFAKQEEMQLVIESLEMELQRLRENLDVAPAATPKDVSDAEDIDTNSKDIQKIQKMEELIDSLSKDVDDSQERNQEFQSQISGYMDRIKLFEVRVAELEAELERSKARNQDWEDHQQAKESLQMTLDEEAASTIDVDQQSKTIIDFKTTISWLEASLDSRIAEVRMLEAKFVNQGLKMEFLECELARASVLSLQSSCLLIEVDEARSEREELLKQLNTVVNDSSSVEVELRAVIEELEARLAGSQQHQDQVATSRNASAPVFEAERYSLESETAIKDLQDRLDTLMQEFEETMAQNDRLHDQLDDQIVELQEKDAKLSLSEIALVDSKKEIRNLEALYLSQGLKLESLQEEVAILTAKQELISSTEEDELIEQIQIMQQDKAALLNELEILEQDATNQRAMFSEREKELVLIVSDLETKLERSATTGVAPVVAGTEQELLQTISVLKERLEKSEADLLLCRSTLEAERQAFVEQEAERKLAINYLEESLLRIQRELEDVQTATSTNASANNISGEVTQDLENQISSLTLEMQDILQQRDILQKNEASLESKVTLLTLAVDAAKQQTRDLEAKYLTQGLGYEAVQRVLAATEAKLVLVDHGPTKTASESANDDPDAYVSDLKAKLKDALLDLKDANDYMDELEQEIARLNAQNSQGHGDAPETPNLAAVQDLEKQVTELSNALDLSKKRTFDIEAKFLTQALKLDSALTTIPLIPSAIPSPNADRVDEMQLLVDELTQEVETNQEQNEKLQLQLDSYLDEIDALRNNIQSLESALASTTEKSVKLETQLSESEEEREPGAGEQDEVIQGLQDQVRTLKSTNTHIFTQLKEAEERVQRLMDQLNAAGDRRLENGGDRDMQRVVQNAFEQVAKLNEEKDLLMEQNEALVRKLEELQRQTPENTPAQKKKGYFF
ncbi:UNVERIFIED_CONTAM: hypothetical protein HDU68_001059 [Siphonaria sp. JEL0065]|nr:hypothetical protein HDU68_001059 [Siphonaria sp. JEL0065]